MFGMTSDKRRVNRGIQRCSRSALLVVAAGVLPIGCGREPMVTSRSAVRVNEFAPKNGAYQDVFGNVSPWIELYNTGDKDFDLEGYYISDSVNKRFKDQFPAGYAIADKSVLLLFADAQPLESSPQEPHLSFKLSHKKGDGIWISDPDGYVVDSVETSVQPSDDAGTSWTSFARFPDGNGKFQWCSEGTPDKLNGDRCQGDVL